METHKVLGLMSGTSLDGLDLAYCHLTEENGKWDFDIIKTKSVSYQPALKSRLKDAIHLDDAAHTQLHHEYGEWLGSQSKIFIEQEGLDVDFISSHGHTSHHQPDKGITFQLGHGQQLADVSGQKVVCDFRVKDVKLGGQGAPLVPIGDHHFFSKYDFCLNLGGISNVSFDDSGKRIAYDIGLANMPLNHIVQKRGMEYDENGNLARTGSLNQSLFDALNRLEYYKLDFPKSTGYEWFIGEVFPLLESTEMGDSDALHTFIHHNCFQIAKALGEHAKNKNHSVFVTGGGAYNGFFMDTLREYLGDGLSVKIPSETLIGFKEAVVFALMGALRLKNKINVLSAVTGASKDSSSG
ncbi:MAG: anhydro-N-acetylmuramic acid kinase, partial [Bacteroidota bacterium]